MFFYTYIVFYSIVNQFNNRLARSFTLIENASWKSRLRVICVYGMVWYGTVWYGIVLYDMYGIYWYSMICLKPTYKAIQVSLTCLTIDGWKQGTYSDPAHIFELKEIVWPRACPAGWMELWEVAAAHHTLPWKLFW